MRKRGVVALLWLAGLLLLGWSLRSARPSQLLRALSTLTLPSILTLIALNTLVLCLLTLRWWLVVRAVGYRVSYKLLFKIRLAGFGFSYFTPGPQFGGEPLQVYCLGKAQAALPAADATASVAVDKAIALLANFSMLTAGILVVLQTGLFGEQLDQRTIWLGPLLLMWPVAYLAALWRGKLPISALGRRLPWKKVVGFAVSAETLAAKTLHHSPRLLIAATLVAGLSWLAMILEYAFMLRALGIEANATQTIAALTAVRLAFLMPTPGGLGTLEAGQMMAMTAMGFPAAPAVTVALLMRLRDILLSLLGLWWGKQLLKTTSPS